MKRKEFLASGWKRRVEVIRHSRHGTPNHKIAISQANNWKKCAVGEAITRVCPDFQRIVLVTTLLAKIEEHFSIKELGRRFPAALGRRDFVEVNDTLEAIDVQISFYRERVCELVKKALDWESKNGYEYLEIGE